MCLTVQVNICPTVGEMPIRPTFYSALFAVNAAIWYKHDKRRYSETL